MKSSDDDEIIDESSDLLTDDEVELLDDGTELDESAMDFSNKLPFQSLEEIDSDLSSDEGLDSRNSGISLHSLQENIPELSFSMTDDVPTELNYPPLDPTDYKKSLNNSRALVVRESREVVPLSPLQEYILRVSKYPLLNRDDEVKWAKKMFDDEDEHAAQVLVTANLRLVIKIALEYQKSFNNIMDVIQEGNTGLLQAVKRFNPYKGVRLSTYAAWWIKAYILKYLMDNKSLVKIGSTSAQRRLFFNLRKEAEKLFKNNEAFDTKLLAENLNVKEKDVVDVQGRIFSSDVSIDTSLVDDEGNMTQMQIPSNLQGADELLIQNECKNNFSELLEAFQLTLSERDAFIFENRMLAEEPLTLQEIGLKYNFSRERARQLEERIMKNLKYFLSERGFKR